jgi:hypothetical protein
VLFAVTGAPGPVVANLRAPNHAFSNSVTSRGSATRRLLIVAEPRPGEWILDVHGVPHTPSTGLILVAEFGGADVSLEAVPQPGSVSSTHLIEAAVSWHGTPVSGARVSGVAQSPAGVTIPLVFSEDTVRGRGLYTAPIDATAAGVYSVAATVKGVLGDAMILRRCSTAFTSDVWPDLEITNDDVAITADSDAIIVSFAFGNVGRSTAAQVLVDIYEDYSAQIVEQLEFKNVAPRDVVSATIRVPADKVRYGKAEFIIRLRVPGHHGDIDTANNSVTVNSEATAPGETALQ